MSAFTEPPRRIRLHWCAALVSFGLAGLLIGLREYFPIWAANIVSNMLIGASVALIHRGTYILVGNRPPDLIYAASVLALGIIYCQYTYVEPNISARIFAVSLFRVPYFVSGASALRNSAEYRDIFGAKALVWLLLAGASWYLFRGGLALSSDELAVLFRTGIMQSVNFLIAAVGNILITLALSRLEAEKALQTSSRIAAQLRLQSEGLEAAVDERTRALVQEVAERKRAEMAVVAERDRAKGALDDLLIAQDHLVRTEKLAALGRMVAGVAHEINSPLGVSVTLASMLSLRLKDLSAGLADGHLRRSHMEQYIADAGAGCELLMSNIQRAADLVHSFKQVAADQTSDELRRFEMGTCLADIVASIGPVWRKAGHRVDIVCPERVDLYGHPGAISQIVTNLVTNSVIHGFEPGQSGVLTISATLAAADTVELCYTDTGKGIAPELRVMVFEPFFTTRRNAGSTGLGLHIIYNLVVGGLGGSVRLEPGDESGVRFIIRFPRTEAAGL